MSDWNYLNRHRVTHGNFYSDETYGFNGAFGLRIPEEARLVCCIASDGMGWQHVSVSFGANSTKTPSWEIMCKVKDLFWEPEDVVVQFHPSQSNYVNNHPGCLHLWRCIDGREQPVPPAIMVGYKELGVLPLSP